VTATVALVMLLVAPATATASPAPQAAPMACKTFSRDGATLPPLVRAWFAHSSDERVRLCPQLSPPAGEDRAPLYFGEGPVAQHGMVCSYPSHVLTLIRSGAGARLQRYEQTEALQMALAGASCPVPHADAHGYVETYDVSGSAFVSIMRLWSETAAAIAAGEPTGVDAAGAEVRKRLGAALGPGHAAGAAVTRVVRIPGSVLHHRYAAFVKVPERAADSASLYVIYVDKNLRGPYWISAFAETN
jgi:hypothetical protein